MAKTSTNPGMVRQGLVARVDFGACVLVEEDGTRHEGTVRGKVMGAKKALGNALVVGDLAEFRLDHDRAMVVGRAPRRNAFSRRASGERDEEQVVAANLDQVVVVASIREPEFKPGFADRVLCQAEHSGIPAHLVLNKIDLAPAVEAEALVRDYTRAGYAVSTVSAKTGEGMIALREACRGRRSLFVGHSGVGKSTLLNAFAPELALVAGHVNPKTGKGRHTTTAAWLLRAAPDLELIDTPGVRTFALWGIGARDLERAYPEFRRFLGTCRFSDCTHDREPGCAIRAAVDSGIVSERRLESFRKLRGELS